MHANPSGALNAAIRLIVLVGSRTNRFAGQLVPEFQALGSKIVILTSGKPETVSTICPLPAASRPIRSDLNLACPAALHILAAWTVYFGAELRDFFLQAFMLFHFAVEEAAGDLPLGDDAAGG